MSTTVLLDTCALIWFANRDPMRDDAIDAIVAAGTTNNVLVSPISAWEVGLLSRSTGRGAAFAPDPQTWFSRVLSHAGVRLAPFTPRVAIAASLLPDPLHNDPADRLLIATARDLGIPIVTRDAKIISYAEIGNIRVIPC
jgi:PIN domain nuclease of toxin-antitoxin system